MADQLPKGQPHALDRLGSNRCHRYRRGESVTRILLTKAQIKSSFGLYHFPYSSGLIVWFKERVRPFPFHTSLCLSRERGQVFAETGNK